MLVSDNQTVSVSGAVCAEGGPGPNSTALAPRSRAAAQAQIDIFGFEAAPEPEPELLPERAHENQTQLFGDRNPEFVEGWTELGEINGRSRSEIRTVGCTPRRPTGWNSRPGRRRA